MRINGCVIEMSRDALRRATHMLATCETCRQFATPLIEVSDSTVEDVAADRRSEFLLSLIGSAIDIGGHVCPERI